LLGRTSGAAVSAPVRTQDTTRRNGTSLRFHPLESGGTLLLDAAVIVAPGAPVPAVLAYRVARQVASAFFHGNVSLHPKLDAVLRTTLDTPDFHGLRHAASAPEQARNLSGGLIWWDRLLGAYLPHPIDDPRRMLLGLTGRPRPQDQFDSKASPMMKRGPRNQSDQRPAAVQAGFILVWATPE